MKRIAIVGGGIAGISAAYELAQQQRAGAPVQFALFEATDRLGGIVQTERRDDFIIECGPDSWISEKSGARELAVELGLEPELIFSRDEHRRTYLAEHGGLRPIPSGMRMMVPIELTDALASPLFSEDARQAYRREMERADELKANAPDADESVRDFVVRHFGVEVADTVAAPLLAGVFGGDIATLSARAVLPALVALERERGSLILGLRERQQANASALPMFTSLRCGLAGLVEAMTARIPEQNVYRGCEVEAIEPRGEEWHVHPAAGNRGSSEPFDAVLLATPAKVTARLLAALDRRMAELLPAQSSSAIVVAFAYSNEAAAQLRIPEGFGFLVPRRNIIGSDQRCDPETAAREALLACTFVDQKFPCRTPPGAVLLRAFFGGPAAQALLAHDDAALQRLAHATLESILGRLPDATIAITRRWPDSLPLYTVGHLDRIAELESRVARFPGLRLNGNAYRGVGLPDLIEQGRRAAREMLA